MIGVWFLLPFVPPDDAAFRDALARYGAARMQAARGEWPAAQTNLQAIARSGDAIEPLRALFAVQRALARYPAAIRTGRAILERDSGDLRTALALSELLIDGQRPADAVAIVKPFLTRPSAPLPRGDLLDRYAAACEKAGQIAEAERALLERTTLFRDHELALRRGNGWTKAESVAAHAAAWVALGEMRLKAGQPAKAGEAFLKADELRRDETALMLRLARSFAVAGDHAKACESYRAYVARKPDDLAARLAWFDASIAAGRIGEVIGDPAAAVDGSAAAWLKLVAQVRTDQVLPQAAVGQFESWAKVRCEASLIAVAAKAMGGDVVSQWYDALARQAQPEAESPLKKDVKAGPVLRALSDAIRHDPRLAKPFIDDVVSHANSGQSRHARTCEFAGWLAERAGRLADAETAYRILAGTNWDRGKPLLALLERQYRWADVAAFCREQPRGNVAAKYTLAYCCAERGDVTQALAIVNQLAADDRLFAEGKLTIRLQQCRVLTAAGRTAQAIQLAESLFEFAKGDAEIDRVRMALGDAYFAAGRPAEGEAQMRAILESDPDDALTLNNLAYNLAEANRNLADAERMARHALEQDDDARRRGGDVAPASGTYLDTLGWVLYKRKEYGEARRVFEQSLSLPDSSFNPVVWDHYGDVLAAQGETTLAIAAWSKAVAKLPEATAGKRGGHRDAVRRKIAETRAK